MAPTAAGRDFSRYAEQLLDLAAEAREVVSGVDEPSGLFKVKCARVAVLVAFAGGFRPFYWAILAEELARGELVVLPWRDRRLRISTQMIWHKDKWISPAMRAFMQMAREEIGGAVRP